MEKKDYSAQVRHLRKTYAKFSIDLRPNILEEFKQLTKANGSTPTTELKKFIASYIDEHKKQD